MKKKIALLLCVAVLTIAFTACGRDKIVGSWEADGITIDGVLMSFDEIIETYGEYVMDEYGGISIDFEKDGTCTFYVTSSYDSWVEYGTWEKIGNGYYLAYIDGEELTLSLDGKDLIMNDGYDELHFSKN